LYELTRPGQSLKKLDKFEGTDEGLFVRKLADVWIAGRKMKAWTYFYPGRKDKAALISSGTFRVRASLRTTHSTRKKTRR
jgi:gamma-glutamylcyclotransferase (GGCT)/AIG2-like uncharacterized protein YtfP